MRFATINIAYISAADLRAGRRFSGWLVLIILLLAGSANATATTQTGSSWLLAQNTTTTDTSSQTPRIISKPQTVVEDETEAQQPTDSSGSSSQVSGSSGDAVSGLLGLLPEAWQQKLEQLTGGTVDGSNDELVKKIALPVVVVVALLFLLPFFLVSLLKRVFRRRPVETMAAAPMHQDHLSDLDLDDIDLTGAVNRDDEVRNDQVERVASRNAEPLERRSEQHSTEPVTTEAKAVSSEDVTNTSLQGNAAARQSPETTLESTAATKSQTVDDLISSERLQEQSTDKYDLSDTSALHDATVELSNADQSLSAEQAKEPIATQPASSAANTKKITPEITGTKGKEPMTGMQQRPAVSQTGLLTAQPMTKFGLWLNDLPMDPGAQYCTEALLYWVSYGAGNVNPQLREELNNATELDDRGRIKRAVLSAKPEIFHDVLLSVQTRFSPAQQLQLLDLMLAVLVSGDGIKPVENLMLRFFCDQTGMGLETLESRYREGFDAELPGLPRPDRLKWWEMQTPADEQIEDVASKRLFGLPATASESQFQRAYKLAEHRHDPSRFGLLGEKQKSLALRNLQKYQAALDARLEEEA